MHCCFIAIGCGIVAVISANDPAPTRIRRSTSAEHQMARFNGLSNKLIRELVELRAGQAGSQTAFGTEAHLPEFTEVLLFAKAFIHATDSAARLRLAACDQGIIHPAGFYRDSAARLC
jgi:hypothetical protein